MKLQLLLIGLALTGFTIAGCGSESQPEKTSETVDTASTDDPEQTSEAEAATAPKSECKFDRATQTEDFVNDIEAFAGYTWNDEEKEATVRLNENETLIAHRGGCDHFEVSCKWTKPDEGKMMEDLDHWFDKGLWMAERVFDEKDYSLVKKLIEEGSYEQYSSGREMMVLFKDHDYSEMYLSVDWVEGDEKDQVIIEIGYYFG